MNIHPRNADPHADARVARSGPPLTDAAVVVVMLHGRGGSADDILSLAGHLSDQHDVAFLAPQAWGHTWYPASFLAPRDVNEPYLSSALRATGRVLDEAAAVVGRERVVVLGFSQGACLACETVTSRPARYGGLVSFTGGLTSETLEARDGDLSGTPVVLTGGDPDPHVPWSRVQETADTLRDLGGEVETHRFPGRAHIIGPDEITRAAARIATLRTEAHRA
ncbi:MAG: dienelactone hydrolase family protein [Planctomycetota bacterium]